MRPLRDEPGVRAGGERDVAPRPGGAVDPGVAREIRQPQVRGVGQRVPAREGDVQRVAEQHRPEEPGIAGGGLLDFERHREVHLTGRQQPVRLRRLGLRHLDGQLRRGLPEPADGRDDQRADRGGEGADPHLARHPVQVPGELRLGLLQLPEHPLGVPQHQPRRAGQAHPPPVRLQHRCAQLLGQRCELLGHRRGREQQALGSGGHRAALVEGLQHPELPEIPLGHPASLGPQRPVPAGRRTIIGRPPPSVPGAGRGRACPRGRGRSGRRGGRGPRLGRSG